MRNFRTFTIVNLFAAALLSGVVLTGCSRNDDSSQCCLQPTFFFHHTSGGTSGDSGDDNGGSTAIMAAEDGEFSIMPVEEPIIIDDQGTGEGDPGNTFQQEWEEHFGDSQNGEQFIAY